MYRLPPVPEFCGLSESEYTALAALPWKETQGVENDNQDMVYLCLKGRVRYGKTIAVAGQLTGILPFVVNIRQPLEFLPGAVCLAVTTQQLARFFLQYPAALRAFTGVLRQSGRELLSHYENHPTVLVIEPGLTSLDLGEGVRNASYFSLSRQDGYPYDQLRTAWAQFYYEALIKKVKAIVVEAEQAAADFFYAEASVMILREQSRRSLPQTPAIQVLVTEKNKGDLKRTVDTLIAICNGTASVRFLCDTGYSTAVPVARARDELALYQGIGSFLAAAEAIGRPMDTKQAEKFFFSFLQPVYPRQTFFDRKYTDKKLRKIFSDRDLTEVGFVTAGSSWRAAGKLTSALSDSIYPPGTNEQMPENILREEYAFFRMLRLGIRRGTYEKAGAQISLSANMRALAHDTFPEKFGRRGIEFQWQG